MQHTIKRSFTINAQFDKALGQYKNKSRVVNDALSIYFEKQVYLQKAENEFWQKKIQEWLDDVRLGKTLSINKDHEVITNEMLEETLWS